MKGIKTSKESYHSSEASGLHPAGALARTPRNEMQPREAGPLAKKCDKSLQASTNTPFEARRPVPKTPNLSCNPHQHKATKA
jgi:hypothetical protein